MANIRNFLLFIFGLFILFAISFNLLIFSYFASGTVVLNLRPVNGIGNQLFQYSAAYSLANATNSKLVIITTKAFANGNNNTPQDRKLGLTNFRPKFDSFIYYDLLSKALIKLANVRLINKLLIYDFKMVTIENFHELALKPNSGVLFVNDYFESEKFFISHKANIKGMLATDHLINSKTIALIESVKKPNSICVHVRRGDFDYHNLLPVDYYKQAIGLTKKIISNADFYLFSDEIKKAADALKDQAAFKIVSSPQLAALDDFVLLSKCHNIITANSTFSWWAAYLGDDFKKQRLVIAPYPFNSEQFINNVIADAKRRFAWKSSAYNGNVPKNWLVLNYHQHPLSESANQDSERLFIYSGDLAPLTICSGGNEFFKNICYANDKVSPPTVVTAYYQVSNKHGHEKYLAWVENFLNIPFNLVVFTDKKNAEWIKEKRGNLPLVLIEKELQDLTYYQYIDVLKQQNGKDRNKKRSPELYVVWHEKVKFVNEAIEQNPFNSDFFVWCDIGTFRDKNYVKNTFPQAKYIWPDKITLGMLKDFSSEERAVKVMAGNEEIRVQGNIQLGSSIAWKVYSSIYDQTFRELIAEGITVNDGQIVAGTAALRHPQLFRLQYIDHAFQGNPWWYFLLYYGAN
jgi:hypothetical protein